MDLRINPVADLRGQVPHFMIISVLSLAHLILDNDKPARVGSMHAGENSKCKDVSSHLETSLFHTLKLLTHKCEAEYVSSDPCTHKRLEC